MYNEPNLFTIILLSIITSIVFYAIVYAITGTL